LILKLLWYPGLLFIAKTEVISTKVDLGIKNRLVAIADKAGKTESELIRDIVMDYLGEANPNSIESMLNRLTAVERKCDRIAKMMLNS